ncbi:MAG: hypothetical protein WD534_12925 [Phycisphaeraceae bacterium]
MIRITPQMFFDRKAVTGAVSRATRRVLSKAGAFVRQRARTLIRPRRRSARPGEPPSSHAGDLRRLIWFGYERQQPTVVIGPAPLHGRSPYGPTTVPEVLEFGGTVTARDHRQQGKRVRRRYRGNPYMGPAMEAEQDQFADLWRGSVRK